MEVSYGDHKSSIECLWIKIRGIITKEDLMLDICYRPPNQDDEDDETLLRLLKEVLGQQNLVLMVSILPFTTNNGSLGYSNHSIVDFKILLSTLKKTSSRTRTLDLRRANFKMLRAQLRGMPWEASMEGKGASKKEAYRLWKGSQIPIEDYKNLARACRDAVRKAKAQLELKMARDVKNNKKGFFRYMSSKQKHREDIGPLLNRAGKLGSNNADKAEVLNTFFASVFTSLLAGVKPRQPQITGSSSYNNTCVDPPSGEEGLVCSLLQGLNPHKSMGLDGIHPRVLGEVADIIVARPLSIIFEKSWRSGDIPDDWKRANVTLIYKKGPKRGPRKLQAH
ncbi:hypothetical protein QYF61_001059 [Mycteria americana]|uniref:Rna-directed dna polymerase from mobile element jockey-like n=1 Tax=Mycteria americana TaxID=33587 RepID=A0AAN7N7R5_MYCAM|nr:hypothetical protein QYF61_001059 [Mycteria americana]